MRPVYPILVKVGYRDNTAARSKKFQKRGQRDFRIDRLDRLSIEAHRIEQIIGRPPRQFRAVGDMAQELRGDDRRPHGRHGDR